MMNLFNRQIIWDCPPSPAFLQAGTSLSHRPLIKPSPKMQKIEKLTFTRSLIFEVKSFGEPEINSNSWYALTFILHTFQPSNHAELLLFQQNRLKYTVNRWKHVDIRMFLKFRKCRVYNLTKNGDQGRWARGYPSGKQRISGVR